MTALAAIPFVQVDPSQNPNFLPKSGDQAKAYWDAITVALASLRRWNPDLDLAVVSNAAPPAAAAEVLGRIDARVILAPFDHRPPPELYHRFSAAFYLLDALGAVPEGTTAMLLDPDVVCIRPIEALLNSVTHGFGALRIDQTTATEDVNGLSLAQSAELHAALGLPAETPVHYGGEVYVVPAGEVSSVLETAERGWQEGLARTARGETRFTTEEHLFNFVARVTGATALNGFVGRIWTAHRFRTVTGDEDELTLWHLPGEKDRGFVQLAPVVADATSWFWTADREQFTLLLGQAFGLHGRPVGRRMKDSIGALLHRLGRR